MAGQLTARQKYMLHVILSGDGTVNTEEWVRRLAVSRRTIQRDLNAISAYLEGFHLSLSVGTETMTVEGKAADLKRMRSDVGKLPRHAVMSPRDREQLLLMDLLMESGPSKLEYFGRLLHVTAASLSQSLDDVADWLKGYDLRLIRRRGYGVEVEGPEEARREALAELVYEQVSATDLVSAFRHPDECDVSQPVWRWFSRWFDPGTLAKLRDLLERELDEFNPPLDAAARFGFMLHVLLTEARVRQGDTLPPVGTPVDESSQDVQVVRRILAAVLPNKVVPDGEVTYLAKHLRGAKVLMTEENMILPIHITAVDLAYRMVRHLEEELGMSLSSDQNLIAGMAQHLEPAIHRLTSGLLIRNQLLPDIVRHYQTLFDAIRTASDEVLKPFGLEVPDAEIGYLTMHLGASVERQRARNKWRARIVCLNGISSAELLASRIQKELPQLQVVGLGGRDEAQAVPYDLVLSTVPLVDEAHPVVTVSPFLTENERDEVLEVLRRLETQAGPISEQAGAAGAAGQVRVVNTGDAKLLSSRVQVVTVEAVDLSQVMQQAAAGIVAAGEADEVSPLVDAMLQRERLGSIVLPGQHLSVLHARTNALRRCQIHLYRLPNSVVVPSVAGTEESVDTVLVLLAREDEAQSVIRCLGRLSSALVMDAEMVGVLRRAPAAEVRERMCAAMENTEE